MRKLFKLKNWLTLEETSRRLSTTFEEQVSIADCLQLAVDGHIVISALFTKSYYGVKAKVVNTTWRNILVPTSNSKVGEDVPMDLFNTTYKADFLDSYCDHIIKSGGIITVPSGVWDLPMIGSEKLDVEHVLALAQGRNPGEFTNLEGAFVKCGEQLVNLMETFNKLEFRVNEEKQVELYDEHVGAFVSYENYHQFFYPADGLGDVEFVFKRENIESFENSQLNDGDLPVSLSESIHVIGTMLDALKNVENKSKRWTQELLKEEMEERNPSLKKRRIDDYFSLANKSYKS